MTGVDPEFPCSIVIDVPLPTSRLATAALRAIQVDAELSPLVRRSMTVLDSTTHPSQHDAGFDAQKILPVLQTEYKATTNRMLRVAVNGFMETLGVVLGVMEELDVDVLDSKD